MDVKLFSLSIVEGLGIIDSGGSFRDPIIS